MPKYKRPQNNFIDPYKSQPLPLGRPVAVYYRQSTEGQIGNISTTLQTVDMVEHLMRHGWSREQILMIDMDAGVSGTKKIDERPGMSRLFQLIEADEIGLAAAQDVDRFFRDVTQIETNIFIDACKRHNVQVLTPTFIYDFAHPSQGRYHMQMFREQAQRAADFIEFHIKGRLLKSRFYMADQGRWVGSTTALGFMVDNRPRLANGSENPNYRKLTLYQPHADVVLAYFELFKQYQGNLKRTWEHVERSGPAVPDVDQALIPAGFILNTSVRTRSRLTGQRIASRDGLYDMFQNVQYIGHWAHRGIIVQRYNHEPIVPQDLFMYAFNCLSPVDFNGDPNPEYIPQRAYVRSQALERPVEPPVYAGVVFCDAVEELGVKRMSSSYDLRRTCYNYVLTDAYDKRVHFAISADYVDQAIDTMLIERLRATTIDERAWQTALSNTHQSEYGEVRRIEYAIKNAERTKINLLDNLKAVSHPDLVHDLEQSYIANEQELAGLRQELETLKNNDHLKQVLLEARPVLEQVIQRWGVVPAVRRRELFDALAQRATVTKLDMVRRRITVSWRDNTETSVTVQHSGKYFSWTEIELQKLKTLVENNTDQVKLLQSFPGVNWKSIQQRYAYHFGDGHWFIAYTGIRKYEASVRWQDTDEYKTNAQMFSGGETSTSKPFNPKAFRCDRS